MKDKITRLLVILVAFIFISVSARAQCPNIAMVKVVKYEELDGVEVIIKLPSALMSFDGRKECLYNDTMNAYYKHMYHLSVGCDNVSIMRSDGEGIEIIVKPTNNYLRNKSLYERFGSSVAEFLKEVTK